MASTAPSASLLGKLLEAAGYRVEVRPDALVAVRSWDRRAVVVLTATRSPADVETLFPTECVRRTIVYDDEPGETARAVAADRGIELLDPSTLGPGLGEILLQPPAGVELSPVDSDRGGPLEPPFAITPDSERTVKPRIDRSEAESLAGVDAPHYTLRLVPFFVAAYRVRPAAPDGGHGAVVRSLVAVNAVTRRTEIWEDGERELIEGLDEPHQRLSPQLEESQVVPLALDAIRRHHTVHVDHTEQHEGALVIETRQVPPSSDDIRLGPFVLLYVPHWYFEGSQGRVVLDAVTGRRTLSVEPGGP
ncbi:MAG TPA: hypothetical protein VEE83_05065 [Thermoplasmata archaeon]|nr:hypothetical protein [Thermoplasmata archaeon]